MGSTFYPYSIQSDLLRFSKSFFSSYSGNNSNTNSDSDDDEDKLPTPAKPSLKMRLFCDENKRELLRSVFEKEPSSTASSSSSNRNQWLGKEKKKTGSKENKRPRVINIDDSF